MTELNLLRRAMRYTWKFHNKRVSGPLVEIVLSTAVSKVKKVYLFYLLAEYVTTFATFVKLDGIIILECLPHHRN